MPSGYKRPLSPHAEQGDGRQKIPRQDKIATPQQDGRQKISRQDKIATPQHALGEGKGKGSMFTFGSAQATNPFTFVLRRPHTEVFPPGGNTLRSNGDSLSRFGGANADPLGDTSLKTNLKATAIPALYNSYPPLSMKETIGEDIDDPMDSPFGQADPVYTLVPSEIHDGEIDEVRSQLSYASYENEYITDRSLPPSDGPGSNRTTPHGLRSSPVLVLSREHSLHQSGTRESTGIPDTIEVPQRLFSSNIQATTNLYIGRSTQVFNPSTGLENQVSGLQNEVVDPVLSGSSAFPNAGAGGVAIPTRSQQGSPIAIADDHLSDISEDVSDPHIAMEPHSRADVEYIPLDFYTTDSTHNSNDPHEGGSTPQVNVRGPSACPFGHVRTRGIFIIGNSAPVKIDEGIEVHLRGGADGRVDFII